MTTRFADHLLDGDHASLPAATAVPVGTLYACTTHALIYQSDGAAWSTWATLGSSSGGGGGGYLPGDPDAPPESPNAFDDEFDAALSGWSTLGSPATQDANATFPGHYYVKRNAVVGDHGAGIYKAPPATPFTVTAKLTDATLVANYNRAALFIGEAVPGKLLNAVIGYGGSQTYPEFGYSTQTSSTSSANYPLSTKAIGNVVPLYSRIVVASPTSVTIQWSLDGRLWRTFASGVNPGFTIGSVGLWVQSHSATNPGEAIFDFIRFS